MENENMKFTLPAIFADTLNKYGKSGAYAFAGEEPLTWETVSARVGSLAVLLNNAGVVAGDRVAILSTNQPNWAIAYFAITFSGAVAVPILPDFSQTEVNNVLEHSGSKLIFVSSGLLNRVEGEKPSTLETVLLADDFTVISSTRNVLPYNPEDAFVFTNEVKEDDVASIIYTSGTTGRSKGVMLTHKNIVFNATRGKMIQPLDETDRFLSVLPLSHSYENTLGLILPLLCGSCVYYLRKPPTPPVLLPALETVRPTIMLTVPSLLSTINRCYGIFTRFHSFVKNLMKLPAKNLRPLLAVS
jgi:long-chain acyl-CoA synthetase